MLVFTISGHIPYRQPKIQHENSLSEFKIDSDIFNNAAVVLEIYRDLWSS